VVRVPSYRTKMYCFLWGTNWIYICGLVVKGPGYRTEMYCILWGTNWIYISYVEESRPPLWSSGQGSWLQNGDVLFPVRNELIYICGLVVKGPGYRSEMYCVPCEVRTEFIYVMQKKADRLCGLVATDPEVRVRFPELPDFLRSSGSVTGST
jgi:hypothetical protein